jgi:hypothetical protein
MVTTIAVMYPNGRIPTSMATIPAKSIKSQALTKNSGPAAMSLKNASTIKPPPLQVHHNVLRSGKCRSSLASGTAGPARALGEQLAIAAGGYVSGEQARVVGCVVHGLPGVDAAAAAGLRDAVTRRRLRLIAAVPQPKPF